MTTGIHIIEWVGAGVFLMAIFPVIYLSFVSHNKEAVKCRAMLGAIYLLITATIYGSMANGQGMKMRADGHTVNWERWALYTASHGFPALLTCISLSGFNYTGLLVGLFAFIFSTAISSTLLFGTLSTGSANYYWVIMYWVADLALLMYFMLMNKSPQITEVGQRDKSFIGETGWWAYLWWILKPGLPAVYMLYGLWYALGQEWNQKYSEQVGSGLYFMNDLMVTSMVLLHVFLGHDGEISNIKPPPISEIIELTKETINTASPVQIFKNRTQSTDNPQLSTTQKISSNLIVNSDGLQYHSVNGKLVPMIKDSV